MIFKKKRDKRYYNQQDRYIQKYNNTFLLGVIYLVIAIIGYFIYKLFS
jgi:hypothetical protein